MSVTGQSAGPQQIAAACGFDPSTPNPARVYDYLLGGKDNFAADRRAARRLLAVLPDAAQAARTNRMFLATAVRYAAQRGVSQFVDIGGGLPTAPSVHDCARQAVPGARVVYVDNDPVVATHARALLATDDLVSVINADARDHAAILAAPEFAGLVDLAEPVCVLFVSMLHFLLGSEADAVVAAFRERMARGSFLVISAGHASEENTSVGDRVRAAYGSGTTLTGRSAAEIAAYFGDFDLVPPGLVPLNEWPLDVPGGAHWPSRTVSVPAAAAMLAGIGCKCR